MEPVAGPHPYLPLRGIRVLAFEIAFSLPAGTRTLAELGAEVVRVAGPARAAGAYIGVIDGIYLSKPCVGINLKHEDGRDLARRLIAEADVVCHNFTPNVMAGFGLSPEDVIRLNPRAIVVQLTGFGSPGPWSDFPAYGPSTEAAGGLNWMTGAPSDPPIRAGSGVLSDQLAGRYATLAMLAALEERRRTGLGGIIDLSMAEAITTLLGPQMASQQLTGRPPSRYGNRHPEFAPQGVYPVAGVDEWIAITVQTENAWQELARLVADPRLTSPDLATAAGRQAQHDQIDEVIADWTGPQDKDALAALLQSHGIAAGPIRKPQDAYFDQHLADRRAFQLVTHSRPQLGYAAHPHLPNPWQFADASRAELVEYRPTGADNAEVLRRWLGIDSAAVEELLAEGALIDVGPLDLVDRPPADGTPLDRDTGDRIGLPKPDAVGAEVAP